MYGKTALERTALEEPAMFCRIVSALLPKQAEIGVDVSVVHQVDDVLQAYRTMADLLGVDPTRGLRRIKGIEPDDGFSR